MPADFLRVVLYVALFLFSLEEKFFQGVDKIDFVEYNISVRETLTV